MTCNQLEILAAVLCNMIFMKTDGSGEYYKFPLPKGCNFFYNL